jgi:hypothetical protein
MMPNQEQDSERLPTFANVVEIMDIGRAYFSADFPNPSRIGCPPAADFTKLLSADEPSSDELRHLFGCSNCFQLYRKALAVRRDEATVGTGWHALVAFMRASSLAQAAAVLVILILLGISIWYVRERRVRSYIASDGHTYSANRSTPQSQQPSDLSAENARARIDIDFNNYRVRRGGNNGENPTSEVSRTTVAFAITLPEGSAAGEYAVVVEDAYGAAVKKTSTQSRDGKMINVEIDLSKLVPQKYQLCVSRKSESPNCYGIILK